MSINPIKGLSQVGLEPNRKTEEVAKQYEFLGDSNTSLGNYQESIDFYFKAIETWCRLYGKDEGRNHEGAARCYIKIANSYEHLEIKKGDFSNTVYYLRKGLDIYIFLYGESHEMVIACRKRMETPRIKHFIDSRCNKRTIISPERWTV